MIAFAALAAILGAGSPARAECARVPSSAVRLENPAASLVSEHLRDASRMLGAAYPGLSLQYDRARDEVHVLDNGTAFDATVAFDRDERSGYAALVLSYDSKHDAALRSGLEGGVGCTSTVELVVARFPQGGSPSIVSRAPLDPEAVAVDVRTVTVRQDHDGAAAVGMLYFAYYNSLDWFGHVGFRSEVSIAGSRLVTHRLPASYLKHTKPARARREGAIGPAGTRPGLVRLDIAVLETGAYQQIEVRRVGEGSLSGAEILSKVP